VHRSPVITWTCVFKTVCFHLLDTTVDGRLENIPTWGEASLKMNVFGGRKLRFGVGGQKAKMEDKKLL